MGPSASEKRKAVEDNRSVLSVWESSFRIINSCRKATESNAYAPGLGLTPSSWILHQWNRRKRRPEAHSIGEENKHGIHSSDNVSVQLSIALRHATDAKRLLSTAKAHKADHAFTCRGCPSNVSSFRQFLGHVRDIHLEPHTTTSNPHASSIRRSVTFPPDPMDRKRFQRIKSWSDLAELNQQSSFTTDSRELVYIDYWVHSTYNPGGFNWMGYREIQLRSCQDATESLLSAKEEMHQWEKRTSRNVLLPQGSLNTGPLPYHVPGIRVYAPSQAGSKAPKSGRSNSKQSAQSSNQGRISKQRSKAQPSGSSGSSDRKPKVVIAINDQNTENDGRLRFACPYWKYDPLIHARCGQTSYLNVSLVRNHLLQCHYFGIFCDSCHRHFSSSEDVCAHVRRRRCSPRKAEEAGIFGNEIKAQLADTKNHLDARDPGTGELRFPTSVDQWYHLWNIVLNEPTLPETPYYDEGESWRPRPVKERWRKYLANVYDIAARRFLETIPLDSSPSWDYWIHAGAFAQTLKGFLLDVFTEMLSNEQIRPPEREVESVSQQSDHPSPYDSTNHESFLATSAGTSLHPTWPIGSAPTEATGSNETYNSASLYASNESSGIYDGMMGSGHSFSLNQNAVDGSYQDHSAVQLQTVSYVGNGASTTSRANPNGYDGQPIEGPQPNDIDGTWLGDTDEKEPPDLS